LLSKVEVASRVPGVPRRQFRLIAFQRLLVEVVYATHATFTAAIGSVRFRRAPWLRVGIRQEGFGLAHGLIFGMTSRMSPMVQPIAVAAQAGRVMVARDR
jgi:hypothetical protein